MRQAKETAGFAGGNELNVINSSIHTTIYVMRFAIFLSNELACVVFCFGFHLFFLTQNITYAAFFVYAVAVRLTALFSFSSVWTITLLIVCEQHIIMLKTGWHFETWLPKEIYLLGGQIRIVILMCGNQSIDGLEIILCV